MSDFKIGGSPFRSAPGVTNGKRAEARSGASNAAPPKGGFDSVNFQPNRLAVMPRMSSVSGQSAQHLQGETVESLLKTSAAELDNYFTEAYGFGGEPQ